MSLLVTVGASDCQAVLHGKESLLILVRKTNTIETCITFFFFFIVLVSLFLCVCVCLWVCARAKLLL